MLEFSKELLRNRQRIFRLTQHGADNQDLRAPILSEAGKPETQNPDRTPSELSFEAVLEDCTTVNDPPT